MSANGSGAADRIERDLRAWEESLAVRWNLPAAFLRGRGINHRLSSANRAIWSADRVVVCCEDQDLAATLAAAIKAHAPDDHVALDAILLDVLRRKFPGVSSRIDVSLYWRQWPAPPMSGIRQSVELLDADAAGLPDLPQNVEHVFAIRDAEIIASWASNIPQLKVDDHWLHSVGVETHADYRRRGFGKAVTAAFLAHIAGEDGAALWVCEASNAASLGLAFSLGFMVHFCVLNWKV